MIAATHTQGDGFRVQKVAPPSVGNGDVLVRVTASAICGTDIRTIRNGHRKLAPGQRIILGHEFAGIIVSSGGHNSAFPAGMRVAVAPNVGCGQCELCVQGFANMCSDYQIFGIICDGAHTEYVRLPHAAVAQGNIVPIDTNAIHSKNLLVTGVTGGSLHDSRVATRLISSRRIDVARVISHDFALTEMALAFEQAMGQDAMQVVLRTEADGAEAADA